MAETIELPICPHLGDRIVQGSPLSTGELNRKDLGPFELRSEFKRLIGTASFAGAAKPHAVRTQPHFAPALG